MNSLKKQSFCLKLNAKTFPITTGKIVVILSEVNAKKLGIQPLDRIEVFNPKNNKFITAVVDTSSDSFLKDNEIGLMQYACKALKVKTGAIVEVRATSKPESLSIIKKKIKGLSLSEGEILKVVEDISKNRLSDIELSAFMTGVYIHGYNLEESCAMAKALADNGLRLSINKSPVVDKHSIGGINGRATMIVVPIIASLGLYIPKTSSRSITSAAGTADAMEVIANVCLTGEQITSITEEIGGVIAWGGALDLAPVDDKIIKIEHPLSIDPEGQVIASVMAKKASVGSKFVVIDIPVGPGLKVENQQKAESLAKKFVEVGSRLGMKVEAVLTDGTQPSGPAFGAGLEAWHALRILEGKVFDDLALKSCELSGALLELVGKTKPGEGFKTARFVLESGKAYNKMLEIIEAQGKKISSSEEFSFAPKVHEFYSREEGEVKSINIKALTTAARMAGSPADKMAGILLNVGKGSRLKKGDLLFKLYAENQLKFEDAIRFLEQQKIFELEKIVLEKFF